MSGGRAALGWSPYLAASCTSGSPGSWAASLLSVSAPATGASASAPGALRLPRLLASSCPLTWRSPSREPVMPQSLERPAAR